MPPTEAGPRLKPADIEKLRRWIDQGAKWKGHWSYLRGRAARRCRRLAIRPGPRRRSIGSFSSGSIARGSSPSPEADKTTLIRRVSFDLTGLPPTIAEIDAFLADTSAAAYERVVDRLLASPRYGERMAQKWLDLARYADTNGYHIDNHRDMWRYREWVIEAFNRNLPFDRFTIEQLAGDLLPGAHASSRDRQRLSSQRDGQLRRRRRPERVSDQIHRRPRDDNRHGVPRHAPWPAPSATIISTIPSRSASSISFTHTSITCRNRGSTGRRKTREPSIRVPSPEQSAQLDGVCRATRRPGVARQRRTRESDSRTGPAAGDARRRAPRVCVGRRRGSRGQQTRRPGARINRGTGSSRRARCSADDAPASAPRRA